MASASFDPGGDIAGDGAVVNEGLTGPPVDGPVVAIGEAGEDHTRRIDVDARPPGYRD